MVARVERLEEGNNYARGDGEGMNELIAKCVREEVYEAKQKNMRRKNSRKLMNCRSMKDVYIGKDWTKKQQREQRILRVALQERREESDRSRDGKTWRIKGSKIIESEQDADVHLVPEVAGRAAAKTDK